MHGKTKIKYFKWILMFSVYVIKHAALKALGLVSG